MNFANEYEIENWIVRFSFHPVLSCAARTLESLKDGVNSCSDGWCHWAAPVRAADRLITMLHEAEVQLRESWSHGEGAITVTDADLQLAYRPIKAFVTRHGARYGFTVQFHYPPAEKPVPAHEPLTLFA